jgi:hypothetical protein
MGLKQFRLYRVCQIRGNGPLLIDAPSNSGPLRLSRVVSQYVQLTVQYWVEFCDVR